MLRFEKKEEDHQPAAYVISRSLFISLRTQFQQLPPHGILFVCHLPLSAMHKQSN